MDNISPPGFPHSFSSVGQHLLRSFSGLSRIPIDHHLQLFRDPSSPSAPAPSSPSSSSTTAPSSPSSVCNSW
ncbi:hypothetical protein C1H46_019623 [Malus baccata]|uniref:Uncharacterized protein n=1 Tax=Malus baccata TaxID=106549 RepID=A0A540M8H1_MALBA|nr:hypothetical protein C1H46_019623 [Malus baccata]